MSRWDELTGVIDQMIEAQERKILEMARLLHPGLTADDVKNPHDYPELAASAEFNYEDGILAGLLSARAAFLHERAASRRHPAEAEPGSTPGE